MKTKTLLAMGLCAAIGLLNSKISFAQEHKEHSDHQELTRNQSPDNLNGIWQEIHNTR